MEPKGPEQKFKVGAVCATVWKREFKNAHGQRFESRKVVVDRTYRDNGEWKCTNNLEPNDIPKAVMALVQAYMYVTTGISPDNATGPSVREEYVQ